MKKIRIIATGGTIAGKADSAADTLDYQAGSLGIEEIIRSVPGICSCAELSAEQFCNIDSSWSNYHYSFGHPCLTV